LPGQGLSLPADGTGCSRTGCELYRRHGRLKKDPDEKLYHRSLGLSLFLYRLVRFELAGLLALRSKVEVAGYPHFRFLKAELEKALQVKNLKNYAEPTKEYIDSVADFLRY